MPRNLWEWTGFAVVNAMVAFIIADGFARLTGGW